MNAPPRMTAIALLLGVVFGSTPAPAGPPATQSAAIYLDDAAFRAALRERGLSDWLDQYLADTPPPDPADARLRQREALLEQATTRPAADKQPAGLIEQARSILVELLAEYPDHPGRLRWLKESVRDTLERVDPGAFEALLLYDLPGRDRVRVHTLADEAVRTLDTLRGEIADRWKAIESLDEKELERIMAVGGLHWIESLDVQASLLRTWARFYQEFSAEQPADQRKQAMAEILAEVTEGERWISPKVPPHQRCRVLLMATVAARLAGESARADQYARAIIAGLKQIEDSAERKRLDGVALLAVLEQVRIMRDRGDFDAALSATEQARQWAERTREQDLRAAVAIALVHRSVLAARGGHSVDRVLSLAEALTPLEQFAGRSPAHRDALYSVLAGALADEPMVGQQSGLSLQLLLGAAVADVASRGIASGQAKDRLEAAISAAREALNASDAVVLKEASRGELLFLLGRAHQLAGRSLQAAQTFCDLVENAPQYDRCEQAVEQAVSLAQQLLYAGDGKDASQASAAFIRAVRLLRRLWPDSPMVRQTHYPLAAALEAYGQWLEAADEYATVTEDDSMSLKARLGRARCLHRALDHGTAAATRPAAEVRPLAEQALQAAREAAEFARTHESLAKQKDNRQTAAEIILLLARLLNHALIDRPLDALTTLEGYETSFADRPALVAAALRERIAALRRLKRLDNARAAVERYLQVDADNAGPLMAQLLEAMRDQINTAADLGDAQQVRRVAAEAVLLAGMLLDWSGQRPGRVSSLETLTIRVWRAWSALQAGQVDDALQLYEQCARDGEGIMPADAGLRAEIRLGQAECLLALGETERALPIFTELWRNCPEHSPYWWRALVGSLESHRRLKHDPQEIIQSIRQQRFLAPDLGGPRWKRALEAIENQCSTQTGP